MGQLGQMSGSRDQIRKVSAHGGVRAAGVDERLHGKLQREVRPKPESGSARRSWCPQPPPCFRDPLWDL